MTEKQRRGSSWLRLPKSRRELFDRLVYILLAIIAVIIVIPFFAIMIDVAIRGLGLLTPEFFQESIANQGLEGGIRNALIGTMYLIALASVVALPLSIGAAIYTIEYSNQGRVHKVVEFTADVLAGVPSIVFGAFGYAFFVIVLHFGRSLLSGALTLALMMIPTLLRTTQESLRAVPVSLREASLALGATRWSTTWRVTLRACFPAIVTGILLAIARVGGETAPLIFTTGYNPDTPWSILDGVANLPFTIYMFAMHPDSYVNQKAYATAMTLVLIILLIDVAANWASRKVGTLVRKE
jgi:phosphate transport system permease protein